MIWWQHKIMENIIKSCKNNIGGWGTVQPGNRFVSVVRACERSCVRLRVDIASEAVENFDKMCSGSVVACRALPLVGFSTATIFGFHISSEKWLWPMQKCSKKHEGDYGICFLVGCFFHGFLKIYHADLHPRPPVSVVPLALLPLTSSSAFRLVL